MPLTRRRVALVPGRRLAATAAPRRHSPGFGVSATSWRAMGLRAFSQLLLLAALLSLPSVLLSQPSPPNASLAPTYLQEAQSLFANNDVAAAVEKARLACQLEPSSADNFKWLGFFLAKQAKKEEAIEALATAVELGDSSSYSHQLLDSLLFTGSFPGWLAPESLPYLPVTFESFHFDLSDFRLPQSRLKGLDGVFTTSIIYPPSVPMAGPGDRGRFNRVCNVFLLNELTHHYELCFRLAYGSPLLWNSDADVAPALRSIVPAAASFFFYAKAYLPEDALPTFQGPLDFWLCPEPGDDSWDKNGIFLYGLTSPEDSLQWYRRIYALLGRELFFQGASATVPLNTDTAATDLVALWSLLNSRPGPASPPPALAALQAEALASLNHFLQNFSPHEPTQAQDQQLPLGAFLYLCSASPTDSLLQTLSSFTSHGTRSPFDLAQPPASFVRFVLDPLLRFNATALQPEDFLARAPEDGTALPPGSTCQYWLSLPDGRWTIDFVARAGSESALVTALDGIPLAQAAVQDPEWKRFRIEVRVSQSGWHHLQVSVPGDVQTLHLKALEVRRLGS